jgi:hypothetical protein
VNICAPHRRSFCQAAKAKLEARHKAPKIQKHFYLQALKGVHTSRVWTPKCGRYLRLTRPDPRPDEAEFEPQGPKPDPQILEEDLE